MTANEVPEIVMHGLTHVGNVREDNQDAIRFCSPDEHLTARHGYLYAVADGMGGLEHGGIASALALETFFNTFYKTDGSSIPKKLREGVQVANLGVFQKARQLGVARMGTTLTAVDVMGHSLNIVHVGDSRAYLVRHGKASCLTNDHTRVGEMVRMKLLSPDKVRAHNQRSVLEKCLGVELFVRGDQVWFSEVSPRPHDTGLVTLMSQRFSEFELHARAILGLPVDVTLREPAASAVIYGGMDAQGGPMAKQMKSLGVKAKFLTGDGGCTPEFIKLAGAASEGQYCSLPGVPPRPCTVPTPPGCARGCGMPSVRTGRRS